jgi:two-component system response regulator DesR
MLRVYLTLEPDIEVLAVTDDAATAQRIVREARPDVVLLDPALSGTDSGDMIRALRQAALTTAVVIFTGLFDPALERAMRDADVSGYTFKGCPGEQLLAAIRAAARGSQGTAGASL